MVESKRDLWGVIPPAQFPTSCGRETVPAYGYVKDDKGKTVYGVSGIRNVVKEINSPETKNLAGVDAARRLIAQGVVSENHFADDGQHGGVFPAGIGDPGELWSASKKSEQVLNKIIADLAREGYDFSGIKGAKDTNEYISSVIKAKIERDSQKVSNGGEQK